MYGKRAVTPGQTRVRDPPGCSDISGPLHPASILLPLLRFSDAGGTDNFNSVPLASLVQCSTFRRCSYNCCSAIPYGADMEKFD